MAKVPLLFELRYAKISYAQCGEDLIVDWIFDTLSIADPTYLDIGAWDPAILSNTFLFYLKGSKGVCIEPNPEQAAKIRKVRPRDTLVQAAIGPETAPAKKFFVFDTSTLSTMNEAEARRVASTTEYKITQELDVPVVTANAVVAEHFAGKAPDLVSLDVEGLDLVVLQSFDFARWRPAVWLIETITFSTTGEGKKIREIIDFMESKRYMAFADTYINTVFVDRQRWQQLAKKN